MLAKVLQLFQKEDSEPQTEEALVADVDKKVKAAENTLQGFHRQWFLNIAMRRGLQYVQTSSTSKAVIVPAETEDRVRIVANKMNGIHQTRVAKIIKDLPRLQNVPAGSTEEDKDLARTGTKILDWVWQNERMPLKMEELVSWFCDAGSGFLMPRWDPNKGPPITKYQRHEGELTGQENYKVDENGFILDEKGERIPDGTIAMGDVAVDFIPSFDVINDQVSTSVQKSNWIIIQQAMTLEEIKERWPEKGGQVKAEKDISQRAYYQRRLLSLIGNKTEFFTPESVADEKMATVKFYFEKKSAKFPQGKATVTAGGVLLETPEMSFGGAKYPLIKFGDIAVSGSFWDIATTELLIAVQKAYNRTLSQILENANFFGNVKLMAPKGHQMAAEAYDDSGNEIIEFAQGFKPEQLNPASLPGYVVDLLKIYDKNFEDISGQHEVSQGRAPAGVKSGAALNALQEQDDTRLAPTKLRLFRGLEELGIMILELYAENQDEQRTFQIVGESVYDIEEVTVSKEDIQSINKNVRVQSENLISAHNEIKKERVVDDYNAGLFGDKDDPKVKKKVLQILEYGNLNEIFEDVNLDASRADKENKMFMTGEGLIPMPDHGITDPATGQSIEIPSLEAYSFEDHFIHIDSHNRFRKSERYRQMTPAQRRSVDFHVEQHENFLNPQKPAPPMPGPVASPPPGGSPPPPLRAAGLPPVMGNSNPPMTPGMQPPPANTPMVTGPDLRTG